MELVRDQGAVTENGLLKKYWMMTAVVVLAVGVFAPWAVGYITEQQWRGITSEMNRAQPLFQLETADYDSGYMGAEVTGTAAVQNPETGETDEFEYRATVSHGITGSLMDFYPSGDLGAQVDAIFADEKPRLTLETRLWGTATVELSVPAVSLFDEETGESFDMSESYSRADISDGGARGDILMLWPGAVIRAPDLRISIEDFRLEQTIERLTDGVWLGEAEAALARLEVAARDQPALRFDQFVMTTATTAADDGESIDSEALLMLEAISANDDSFGPHRIEFLLEGLDVQSWSNLRTALADMQSEALAGTGGDSSAAMQQQMAAMNRLNQAMVDIAGNGVVLGIPSLSLATPYGPISGELRLQHPALSDDEKDRMMMVMQRLNGHLDVSLPLALVEQQPALGIQVAPLIKQGMVVKEGDRLRLQGSLEDLALDINGNLIPLPPLF